MSGLTCNKKELDLFVMERIMISRYTDSIFPVYSIFDTVTVELQMKYNHNLFISFS